MSRFNLDRKRLVIIGAGLIAVVLLVAVAVVAASGGDTRTSTADTTTTTTLPPTTTTTAPPISALTGLPGDPALLSRPAIIVKIDNTAPALPLQEGVDRADVVVVEQVEGGVTRMAAVFQSQNAEPGPIRSARNSDLAIAPSFGVPLFTNSGGNGGVLASIRNSDALVDTGIDSPGAAAVFGRHVRGSGVHRFFVPIEELYAIREGQGTPPQPLFKFRAPDQLAGGDPVAGVTVVYASRGTNVRYDWNGTGWARTQDGRLHQMAHDGPKIVPANVIVMSTTYRDSGYVDVSGNKSPEAVLTGSGDVAVFSAGKVIYGKWSDVGGRLSFDDNFGQPIPLTPGQTFIELDTPGGYAAF